MTIISANLILSTSRLGTGMGREVSHLLATKGRKGSNKATEIKKNDSTFERADQLIAAVQTATPPREDEEDFSRLCMLYA